jgi:hypothetical protein
MLKQICCRGHIQGLNNHQINLQQQHEHLLASESTTTPIYAMVGVLSSQEAKDQNTPSHHPKLDKIPALEYNLMLEYINRRQIIPL